MSEEQDREIAAALGQEKPAPFVATPTEIIPPVSEEDWKGWEDSVEARLTALVNDSKMLKLSVGAVACVGLAAIAASAMVAKSMAGIMGAMNQLGLNQQAIAEAIGMTDQPTPIPADAPPTEEELKTLVNHPEVADVKTVDLDPDAVVGKPHDGPASEASAAAVAQMEQDKASGLIDLSKGEAPGVEEIKPEFLE